MLHGIQRLVLSLTVSLIAVSATAQPARTDSCLVAGSKAVADSIAADSLPACNDTLGTRLLRLTPRPDRKPRFHARQYDSFKEKMKSLNLSETIRDIIKR